MPALMTRAEIANWGEKISANGWPWSTGDILFDIFLIGLWLIFFGLLFILLFMPATAAKLYVMVGVTNSGSAIFTTFLVAWILGWGAYYAMFGEGPAGYEIYKLLGPESFVTVGEFFHTYFTILGVFTWFN